MFVGLLSAHFDMKSWCSAALYYPDSCRWGPVDTVFVDFRLLQEFERRNNRLPVPQDKDVMKKLADEMLLENGLNTDFLPESGIAALCCEVRRQGSFNVHLMFILCLCIIAAAIIV